MKGYPRAEKLKGRWAGRNPGRTSKSRERTAVRSNPPRDRDDRGLDGLICPIHKKGHRLDCSNFRGITLLNTAYEVLFRILFSRLRSLTKTFVGEYQGGFREGRSTTAQMFTLRQILGKFREYNLQTHHLFVYFKAAYDSVKRNEL